jgi:soluble lytic murein transglycosylase
VELEDLRNSVSTDPVLSYRLANYLLDIGAYRSGIFAARQVLTLAGLKDNQASLMAPAYFNNARYGLYYSDLIQPAAQENSFDPLFLFSVMRQESLYESFAGSTAGAIGLMQLVPLSGGADSAARLGWPVGFDPTHPEPLYLPQVSIKLGANDLAYNRDIFGGNLYAALAGYNAGTAQAYEWKQLSGNDPDLFLEVIRFDQTRQYIQGIYEIYAVYRRLYTSAP